MAFVRAYSDEDGNTLISVSEEFAESAGLHTVKDPAIDSQGRALPPSEGYRRTSDTKSAKKNTDGGAAASTAEEASK